MVVVPATWRQQTFPHTSEQFALSDLSGIMVLQSEYVCLGCPCRFDHTKCARKPFGERKPFTHSHLGHTASTYIPQRRHFQHCHDAATATSFCRSATLRPGVGLGGDALTVRVWEVTTCGADGGPGC